MTARRPTPGLVVLDVDGTLIERDTSIPPARAEAFHALVAAVPTALATGKTAPSITGLLARFAPAGPHAICNGAALVHGDGHIEVLAALADDVADEVAAALHERGVAAASYLDDGSVVTRAGDDRFEAITALGEPAPTVAGRGHRRVLKVLAVLGEHEERDLRGLVADRARIQRTGPDFLEWNAPTASKGAAVAVIADRHGVAMADVVAVGDSENDVPMLEAAGWGVAVRRSSARAVAAADEHLDGELTELLTLLVSQVTGRP